MKNHNTYRELQVWQRAIAFAVEVYAMTKKFPKEEQFGLISQMRRAAVSISSNIAEGQKRGLRKDFAQFLRIANGSCAEIDSQLEIALQIGYLPPEEYEKQNSELIVIMKMIAKLLTSIQPNS